MPTTDEAGRARAAHDVLVRAVGADRHAARTSSPSSTPRWSMRFDDPAVRQRLTDQGHDIPPREQQTPEALGAHHKAEIEKWWPIIKAAGIKLQ